MKEKINKIIKSSFLSQTPDKAYYKEASVQLKIGIRLWKLLKTEVEMEKHIYNKKTKKNEFLDIFFIHDNVKYGIELKYKTIKNDDLKTFLYTNQGAQDHGRYDFIKDIKRIETFVSKGIIAVGFSCLITNDKAYWRELRNNSHGKPFELSEGKILHGKYTPTWKNRTDTISLRQKYTVEWQSSNSTDAKIAPFRSLLIECPPKT